MKKREPTTALRMNPLTAQVFLKMAKILKCGPSLLLDRMLRQWILYKLPQLEIEEDCLNNPIEPKIAGWDPENLVPDAEGLATVHMDPDTIASFHAIDAYTCDKLFWDQMMDLWVRVNQPKLELVKGYDPSSYWARVINVRRKGKKAKQTAPRVEGDLEPVAVDTAPLDGPGRQAEIMAKPVECSNPRIEDTILDGPPMGTIPKRSSTLTDGFECVDELVEGSVLEKRNPAYPQKPLGQSILEEDAKKK
ncbi:MAG: hypothetical protein ACYTEQ_05270 [Planctomycetota bacterium]|jgi:hypothetical protein